MSEVTPPPPPPSSPLPAQPAPPPTATVTSPPPALLELPVGARLEAVIAAVTGQGKIEIDTAIGRLLLASQFPLPKDGPLTLQLLAKGPVAQLLITAIHGLRPEAALRTLGLATPGQAPAGTSAAPGRGAAASPGGQAAPPAAIALTVGATLTATLLRPGAPAATPATPGATQATVPGAATTPGAPSTAAAPGVPVSGSPATPAGGHAAPGRPGAATPGTPATGGPATATTTSPGSPAPAAGSRFAVRIVAFQPAQPGAAPPPLRPGGPTLTPGSTLTGVVTASARPSGHPIVQTAAGALIVATRTPLPQGSSVTFEVLSQTSAPTPATHPGGHGAPAPLTGGAWPALDESLAALQQVNPAAAQQLAQAVLPRPGASLGANMLFYLVALAGGDLRGWIGDGPARILGRFRPDLLARLGDDFGRIARVADDRGPGEWRTFLMPMFTGAEVQPVRLYTRPAGDDDENADKGRKGTRFVVDITLSRLGRLQLDGLVYAREKHMDLIVRTENRLPDRIENDIRGIFEDAGDVTGLKGGIGFQAAPPNFVEVAPPEPPEGEHVGLIV